MVLLFKTKHIPIVCRSSYAVSLQSRTSGGAFRSAGTGTERGPQPHLVLLQVLSRLVAVCLRHQSVKDAQQALLR